jgi:hypothetical protein
VVSRPEEYSHSLRKIISWPGFLLGKYFLVFHIWKEYSTRYDMSSKMFSFKMLDLHNEAEIKSNILLVCYYLLLLFIALPCISNITSSPGIYFKSYRKSMYELFDVKEQNLQSVLIEILLLSIFKDSCLCTLFYSNLLWQNSDKKNFIKISLPLATLHTGPLGLN